MKRVVVVAMVIALVSVLAVAQAAGGHTAQSVNSEQEIILLSRQFAEEAIIIRQGETLDVHDIRVRISGNTAWFTSRADKRGQEETGRAYLQRHLLSVEYVRREGRWHMVRGRWGDATK